MVAAHRLVGVGVHQSRQVAALGRQDVARGLAPPVEEAEVGHPLVVVELRQVAPAGVWEQHDDHRIRSGVAPDLEGRPHRGAAGPADEEALLPGDPSGGEEGVAIADLDDPVDDVGVVAGRPEVLADALDEVRPAAAPGVHRALGVGADDLHVGVGGLQRPADPGDRAPGADAGDEVGDPALGLAPDLRSGGRHVGRRVGGVVVLVGLEGAGDLPHQAVRHRVVRVGVLGGHRRGADDDLGAVGPEQGDLLRGDLVRHDERAAVATAGGDDRQPDARVARGRLDDRAPRLQQAVALGRVDHGDRGPVLHAAAGVEHLQLPEQLPGDAPADPVQVHQGGVADQVEQGVGRGQEVDVDGRADLDAGQSGVARRRPVGVEDRGQAGPVEALGDRHRVVAGAVHADLAGQAATGEGDRLRVDLGAGEAHDVAGPGEQALGWDRGPDEDEDVHAVDCTAGGRALLQDPRPRAAATGRRRAHGEGRPDRWVGDEQRSWQ